MNRELIAETLLARLQTDPLVFNFTASIDFASTTLTNVSDTSGLRVGMPLFGAGIPVGATVATLEPEVTMSRTANTTALGVAIGQGFRTFSRRRKEIGNNQPALFLADGDEDYPGMTGALARGSREPAIITLRPDVFVFVQSLAPDSIPATPLNALLDALEEALDPKNGGVLLTLGLKGVMHVRIEGHVAFDGGHLNGQAGAKVPLAIRVLQGIETVVIPPA